MLQELVIRNIALIDEVSLSFREGFHVMTGETGAGKSIIVDAVNLILGSRGDRELIKHGETKAYVEALFDLPDGFFCEVLQEFGLENHEGQLILSRELSISGKNICRANGRMIPLNGLREIAEHLIHLHGQNQSQTLLDERRHLGILDHYAGVKISALKTEVSDCFERYANLQKEYDSVTRNIAERERLLDVLDFQISEIVSAKLKNGEEEELLAEKKRLANAEKLSEILYGAKEALIGENGAVSCLDYANKLLQQAVEYYPGLEAHHKALQEAYYAAQEAGYESAEYAEQMQFDPLRLDQIEDRLITIAGLKRKYGSTVEEVLNFAAQAEQKRKELKTSELRITEIEQQLLEVKKTLDFAANQLTQQRKQAAARFEEEVVSQLCDLGMTHAKFEVQIEKTEITQTGQDVVRFMISVNQGVPVRPLAKIASGGETSRIMLAMKSIEAAREDALTMIFDEIDAGISGEIAHIVAQKIARIATERQVICVTHLPQIAAMADVHFFIEKRTDESGTQTSVQEIAAGERIREIARLSGGNYSKAACMHAKELLEAAQKWKNGIK